MTVSEYLGLDDNAFHRFYPLWNHVMQRWHEWALAATTTATITFGGAWFALYATLRDAAITDAVQSQRIVALERSLDEIKGELRDIKELLQHRYITK